MTTNGDGYSTMVSRVFVSQATIIMTNSQTAIHDTIYRGTTGENVYMYANYTFNNDILSINPTSSNNNTLYYNYSLGYIY